VASRPTRSAGIDARPRINVGRKTAAHVDLRYKEQPISMPAVMTPCRGDCGDAAKPVASLARKGATDASSGPRRGAVESNLTRGA
jgi:hypothetical protein